jgi:hypothetical protein
MAATSTMSAVGYVPGVPHQHRHHHTTTMEPLDLGDRRQPPRRPAPRSRRPGTTRTILGGWLSYLRASAVIAAFMLLVALVAVALVVMYGFPELPNVADKVTEWRDSVTTTTAP